MVWHLAWASLSSNLITLISATGDATAAAAAAAAAAADDASYSLAQRVRTRRPVTAVYGYCPLRL